MADRFNCVDPRLSFKGCVLLQIPDWPVQSAGVYVEFQKTVYFAADFLNFGAVLTPFAQCGFCLCECVGGPAPSLPWTQQNLNTQPHNTDKNHFCCPGLMTIWISWVMIFCFTFSALENLGLSLERGMTLVQHSYKRIFSNLTRLLGWGFYAPQHNIVSVAVGDVFPWKKRL